MVYTPPKYPGAIPTITDLPNRVDDVDWLLAARYNELKKELRAALIELGTDPAGTSATVKDRLDDLLPHFHDRGDATDWDFEVGDLNTNGAYHDLDLSGIVPAGAKAVALYVYIADDAVNSYLWFRKNGNANSYNRSLLRIQVANVYYDTNIVVACDTNRVIEYLAANVTWVAISILVIGWWK